METSNSIDTRDFERSCVQVVCAGAASRHFGTSRPTATVSASASASLSTACYSSCLVSAVQLLSIQRIVLATGLLASLTIFGQINLPNNITWSMIPAARAQESDSGSRLKIPSAIQFPIVFKSLIDSSKAQVGDEVIATLKEDLVIDEELIAPEGSVVVGHIAKLKQSRRLTESVISKHRRFHKGSSMKIELDEIVTDENEHIPIVGCLSKQSANFFDGKQPREVEINANGELIKAEAVFTSDQKVASQIVNFAASTGVGQLGTAASFGALPVVMGVIGAVEPAMVMSRPMKPDEKHPRVKGFAWGVWTTVPGAPVIQAVAFKGSDLRIEPGDEFLAQAHSPYDPVLTVASKILRRNVNSVSAVRLPSTSVKAPTSGASSTAAGAIPPTTTAVKPATPSTTTAASSKAASTITTTTTSTSSSSSSSATATVTDPKLPASPAAPRLHQVSASTKSQSL